MQVEPHTLAHMAGELVLAVGGVTWRQRVHIHGGDGLGGSSDERRRHTQRNGRPRWRAGRRWHDDGTERRPPARALQQLRRREAAAPRLESRHRLRAGADEPERGRTEEQQQEREEGEEGGAEAKPGLRAAAACSTHSMVLGLSYLLCEPQNRRHFCFMEPHGQRWSLQQTESDAATEGGVVGDDCCRAAGSRGVDALLSVVYEAARHRATTRAASRRGGGGGGSSSDTATHTAALAALCVWRLSADPQCREAVMACGLSLLPPAGAGRDAGHEQGAAAAVSAAGTRSGGGGSVWQLAPSAGSTVDGSAAPISWECERVVWCGWLKGGGGGGGGAGWSSLGDDLVRYVLKQLRPVGLGRALLLAELVGR
jgi:hypothetical protein